MKLNFEKIAVSVGVIAVVVFILGNAVASAINNTNTVRDSKTGTEEVQVEERIVEEIKKESIPYETNIVNDDSVEYGKTVVRVDGKNGEKTYVYSVTYKNDAVVSRELIKEEITRQPVTKTIAKGTKVVWSCRDVTSYDRNPNNDNYCVNSLGNGRYVSDCEAAGLDPSYKPPQYGARRYNGCAR